MKCIQLRKGENQQANCTWLHRTCNLFLNALFSRAYVMRLFLNFALLGPWTSPLLSLFFPFAAKITCNGELAFYDQRRDKLVVSRSPANISLWSTSDSGIQDLAVSCHNNKTKPWIMGSVSNGMVTDDRWKCFSQEKEGLDNMSWVTSLFDDTHWAQAVANYSNTHSPWGKVPDISNNAFWISTADKDDSKLICRRRLSEVSLIRKRSNSKIFIISRLNHHHHHHYHHHHHHHYHHHLVITDCKNHVRLYSHDVGSARALI